MLDRQLLEGSSPEQLFSCPPPGFASNISACLR
jgi:hypothetical protein